MIQLIQNMNSFAGRLAAKIPALCLLARFVFAAVLLVYFWASGLSKLGEGLLGLRDIVRDKAGFTTQSLDNYTATGTLRILILLLTMNPDGSDSLHRSR